MNAILAVNSIPFLVFTAKRERRAQPNPDGSGLEVRSRELDSVYSARTGLFGRLRFPLSKLSMRRRFLNPSLDLFSPRGEK